MQELRRAAQHGRLGWHGQGASRTLFAARGLCVQLSGRRLQNHGGVVHSKGLLQSKIPSWLAPLTQRLHTDTSAYGDQPPNHVLVNAYRPGEGIMVSTEHSLCNLSRMSGRMIDLEPCQSIWSVEHVLS